MKTEDYDVQFTRHSWRWWSVQLRIGSGWYFKHGTHRACLDYFREKMK